MQHTSAPPHLQFPLYRHGRLMDIGHQDNVAKNIGCRPKEDRAITLLN